MPDIARWTKTLERNRQILERQAEGVTQEQSLRPLYPGGTTFNWMLGHLAFSRDRMLVAAGAEAIGGETLKARYVRGTRPPGAEDASDTAELVGMLARQETRLASACPARDASTWDAPSGMGEMTNEQWLDFLIWHETYHLGQAALYRGALNLDSVIG